MGATSVRQEGADAIRRGPKGAVRDEPLLRLQRKDLVEKCFKDGLRAVAVAGVGVWGVSHPTTAQLIAVNSPRARVAHPSSRSVGER